MKTIVGDEHNRIWSVDAIPGYEGPLKVEVRYRDPGGCREGIALDHHIVPLFKASPRMLDALRLFLEAYRDGGMLALAVAADTAEAAIADTVKEDA